MGSVPEIGEDLPEKNPLLRNDGLPEFNNITIENCVAAVGTQTMQFENGIKSIEESLKTLDDKSDNVFDNVFSNLEQLGTPLDTTWGLSKTLYLGNRSLMPTKCYLTIHERAKRARATKFNSNLIYNFCKEEYKNQSNKSEEQQRVLKKYILEGKLNGLEMDSVHKAQLREIINKLVSECSKFKGKVETATKQFAHTINDSSIMRDFPEPLLKVMAVDESQPLKGPWKVNLQPQISDPFMEYCPDRDLRWNVWQAQVQRASGYTEKALENSTHIEGIRSLRRDQAKMLGYESYVHMSMETKMAKSVDDVRETLDKLLERAKPAQERELTSLTEFAKERGFEGNLELWDIPYWKRKQRKTLYSYDEENLKEYFQLPKVLSGLYELSERLFNIKITERSDTKAWHKDVKFYDIFEPHCNTPTAGFYLDPYSRENEKIRTQENSGWMVGIRNHSYITETKPLAALIFNFQSPNGEKPSLLNFQEVSFLFHKFGHALQHLLNRTTYSEVAGLSNVEWDAVEICGHVMSHWLYNSTVLQSISSHYESEDPLPRHLVESLQKSRQHMSGLDLCRKLYLSSLDLELYSTKDFWLDIVKRLWPEHFLLPLDKYDSHPCSFTEIFSGEWAAAYYSHLWSQVIAADVYSAFHEARGDNKHVIDVGKRFRDTFLALGGGCHPSEVFRRFRGRDPSPKALLAILGLKEVPDITNREN